MMIFVMMIFGHAIGDWVLQNDFMAKYKARSSGPIGGYTFWPYVLSSHAMTHGALVWGITGSMWLGLFETFAHFFIDFGKCEKWYGLHVDQFAHFACKALWAILMVKGIV